MLNITPNLTEKFINPLRRLLQPEIHLILGNDPVPSGCTIDEAELNGLFFQLIDSGYNGLAFLQGGAFIGIEWKDLMMPPASGK
jgi:hypothetical protein